MKTIIIIVRTVCVCTRRDEDGNHAGTDHERHEEQLRAGRSQPWCRRR